LSLYRKLGKYLLPYWKYLTAATLSMIIFALLSAALIWLIGPLMGTLFEYESDILASQTPTTEIVKPAEDISKGQRIAGSFERFRNNIKAFVNSLIISSTKIKTLRNLCLAIILIAISKSIFYYMQGYFMVFVEQKFTHDLRMMLFTHYQKLSLTYFHGTRTGQLISHVTNDVMIVRDSLDQVFNRAIRDPLLVLIYIAFMFIISWKLLLITVLILPITFLLMYIIGRKIRKYSTSAQERMADLNTVLEENISNIRIVKGFNTDDFEIGKFTKQAVNYFQSLLKIARFRICSTPINELLGTIAVVTILWFGGQQVLSGNGISASDFMLYAFAMFSLSAHVKSLFLLHIKVQEGMAAVERIFSVLDKSIDIKDSENPVSLPEFKGEIRFENISFSYKDSKEVLTDINFTAKRGELIAIVGPSGAGKSTLCDLVPRFYDPQKGRILIDKVDLREIKLASLRKLLGIVTQETMLFNDTILNNITYGLGEVSSERVTEAIKIANAYEFIMGFEHGLDTPIGNKGVMLSGGQRQRIAIARAVLRDPQILIFDEATSSLDTESEQLVQEAIDRLLKGRTTLVIAHRLSTILNADKILVIQDGKLIDTGTHQELIAREGLYQRLYNLQFREQNGHES